MGFRINGLSRIIESNLERTQQNMETSMERISSGVRFTRNTPLPAEQAQSSSLTAKEQELGVYKQNAKDGLSLTQYVDANLNEISTITLRMKELVTQATSPSLSDKERAYLFVEYQSLYKEVDRIASSTQMHGISLLDDSPQKEHANLSFCVGPSTKGRDGEDSSVITVSNFDKIQATTRGLKLVSMEDSMPKNANDGISLDDMLDDFDVDNADELSKKFDNVQNTLNCYRASFGAATVRLTHSEDSLDTAQENVRAANSRIKDVDYATEITQLVHSQILQKAGTSMLIQESAMGRNLLELLNRLPQ